MAETFRPKIPDAFAVSHVVKYLISSNVAKGNLQQISFEMRRVQSHWAPSNMRSNNGSQLDVVASSRRIHLDVPVDQPA